MTPDSGTTASLSGARVLITGGLGFIGSRLALHLIGLGSQVTVLDLLAPDGGANDLHRLQLGDGARVVVGDAGDADTMRALVEDVDCVFNLAALVGHMDSMQRPHEDMAVNVGAQLTLLEACRQTNPGVRIIHTSTRQVYGRAERSPVDETHPLRPPDVNGVHKLAGEMHHALYGRVYGLRSTILRLTNVYGPGMRIRDARQTFIGLWIRALLEGTPFEVWGGDQLRDLLFVDDAVEALVAAARSDQAAGETFNVGGSEPISLRALADLLAGLRNGGGYVTVPYPAVRRPIEIGSFVSDSGKFQRTCGWVPRIALREGLVRTVEYYSRHLSSYVPAIG